MTLPHDAMIGTGTIALGHAATAYFPERELGVQEVVRALARRRRERRLPGVRRRVPRCAGAGERLLVAHRPGGYSDFTVQVDHLLRSMSPTRSRSRHVPTTTAGGTRVPGIYRSVWLLQAGGSIWCRAACGWSRRRSTTTWQWWPSARRCGTNQWWTSSACCAWRSWTPGAQVVAGAEAPVTRCRAMSSLPGNVSVSVHRTDGVPTIRICTPAAPPCWTAGRSWTRSRRRSASGP